MTESLPARCAVRQLEVHGDARGSLIAIEGGDALFPIARAYYIFGTACDAERGFHAHTRLRQLAVCVAGACTLKLDNGQRAVDIRLDRPDKALEIGPMIWREMRDFTPDCVLLVLADRPYEPADYITDREAFARLARSMAA